MRATTNLLLPRFDTLAVDREVKAGPLGALHPSVTAKMEIRVGVFLGVFLARLDCVYPYYSEMLT